MMRYHPQNRPCNISHGEYRDSEVTTSQLELQVRAFRSQNCSKPGVLHVLTSAQTAEAAAAIIAQKAQSSAAPVTRAGKKKGLRSLVFSLGGQISQIFLGFHLQYAVVFVFLVVVAFFGGVLWSRL